MSASLIINAVVVLADGIKTNRAVLLRNGKIADIDFKSNVTPGIKVIDAKGGFLFPGFIDIHVHGGGGADFMDASVEAFETIVNTHLRHGTTLLLPTAMTASENELAQVIKCYKEFKAKSPYATLAYGLHFEGPYFSGADSRSSGAQNTKLLRFPDSGEIDRLLLLADGDICRWDAAPELKGADMFAKKMRENRIICSIAHSNATGEEAQLGIENGFSHVTHFYNAVTTYHKTNQTVNSGIVEAAYLNSDVSVELICDGKHIPEKVLKLALKIKGTRAVSAITDAMRLAGTKTECGKLGSLKNGTNVIVDDGVAKLPDKSSFAGSVATMERCLQVLCIEYGISPSDASVMLSGAPSRLLGIQNKKGSIKNNFDADLVITDKRFNVTNVLVAGIEI